MNYIKLGYMGVALHIFQCVHSIPYDQIFALSRTFELRREESCCDSEGGEGKKVRVMPCHGGRGNQEWKHDKVLY